MNYTILYATSVYNPSLIVDLSKNGNKYHCTVWHCGEHSTVCRAIYDNFEEAQTRFNLWCKAFNMTAITETVQTWSATDFD